MALTRKVNSRAMDRLLVLSTTASESVGSPCGNSTLAGTVSVKAPGPTLVWVRLPNRLVPADTELLFTLTATFAVSREAAVLMPGAFVNGAVSE